MVSERHRHRYEFNNADILGLCNHRGQGNYKETRLLGGFTRHCATQLGAIERCPIGSEFVEEV